jgi:hypothetical protein
MAPARRWPPLLRSGNAGSNTAADHIELLDAALAGLPAVAEDYGAIAANLASTTSDPGMPAW